MKVNSKALEMTYIIRDEIRKLLSGREIRRITDPNGTRAAVLVPLFEKENTWHILFIKRTTKVSHHKGQISFPGGAYDEADQTLETTALRETFEEIGVNEEAIEILGELDDSRTVTSNYIISAFVGYIEYSQVNFQLHEFEIEEHFEVPLSVLLQRNNYSEGWYSYEGKLRPAYFYQYKQHVIWGATARILKQFLDLIKPIFSSHS
ncbi:MAG: NUDIX hydrolase [Candidatus Heimdallarchaeota archaeon]